MGTEKNVFSSICCVESSICLFSLVVYNFVSSLLFPYSVLMFYQEVRVLNYQTIILELSICPFNSVDVCFK